MTLIASGITFGNVLMARHWLLLHDFSVPYNNAQQPNGNDWRNCHLHWPRPNKECHLRWILSVENECNYIRHAILMKLLGDSTIAFVVKDNLLYLLRLLIIVVNTPRSLVSRLR